MSDENPLLKTPPRRKTIYPRTYGKPKHALRIPATEAKTDRVKQTVTVESPLTGEERTAETIQLPNGVVAVKIWARDYVFVDAEDVATVVGYPWRVRGLNSFNAHYRGLQTFWDEPAQEGLRPVRLRMFLHDLLMDTPQRSKMALYEVNGPFWIVEHRDYNGMNCTRANMTMMQSADGYVPIPRINLPVGVWWNYRKHRWSVRCMPEGQWYVELGTFKTFEEGAIAYFNCLDTWTPERRGEAQFAWGEMIEYRGVLYSLDEWTALRAAERDAEKRS